MDIHSIDHLELFVEDAEHTAARLCEAYGFAVHGRGGPETGLADCRSILLRQRQITLLITSATSANHRAAEYVKLHGDGVAVVGLAVPDAQAAFTEAVERGALPIAPPAVSGPDGARVTFASVNGFGDVEHRFTSRESLTGAFAPGAIEELPPVTTEGGLFEAIDHLAVCLPAGTLEDTVRHYCEVFDFDQTFEEQIRVGNQAMESIVVESPSREVTFTLIESDRTKEAGQIDEFVRSNAGAGVQHIALLTSDIVEAVRVVSATGVRFLNTPDAYYDALKARLDGADLPVETLREWNILADRDNWGLMLQIFAESELSRRTMFYELIDRRGARTFGSNNIKALYEAVERQRGTKASKP